MYIYTQIVDITANTGDDLAIPLTVTVGAYPSLVPQNITGWTFSFVMKNLQTDLIAAAVVNQSVVNHIDPLNGLTSFYLTAATTAALKGTYYYYLSWIDSQGNTQVYQKGKITFTN